MMNNICTIGLTILVVTLSLALAEQCQPKINCYLPHCRCWNDPTTPGNVEQKYTPQIILLTFAYAINNHTISRYMPLFKDLMNPNDCFPKGTFFTQDRDSDPRSIASLYKSGHEIALTSSNGQVPRTKAEWVESLYASYRKLMQAGVPKREMKGVRSPQQYMGGNDELKALQQFGLNYDASCVTHAYEGGSSLWPYTYDFVDGEPKCDIGLTPNTTFKGMWQFLMPDMKINGHKCSSLSGCSPYIHSSGDAFTLLFNTFQEHYYKTRAPMILYVDAQWMTKDVQVQGLRQFLEFINEYPKVWMVTMSQALDWIRYPVSFYPDVKFWPWECPKKEKMMARMAKSKRTKK